MVISIVYEMSHSRQCQIKSTAYSIVLNNVKSLTVFEVLTS